MPKSRVSPAGDAVQSYEALRPTYERFTVKLEALLRDLLQAATIQVHAIESRTKAVESFAEKIRRQGKAYGDPVRDLTDLSGVRIILYYQDDIDRTCEILEREFAIDLEHSIDKRLSLAADQFGYLSVHKVVRLATPRTMLAEWHGLAALVAEIQVRTVLQHSWAAIQHKLEYKSALEVPREFRRRLVRLSGLLELADDEFAALRKEQAALTREVAEQLGRGRRDLAINRITVREFLIHSQEPPRFNAAAKAEGMEVIGESGPDEQGMSQLVRACELAGIQTIEDLENALKTCPGSTARAIFRAFSSLGVGVQGTPAHVLAVVIVGTHLHHLPIASTAKKLGWTRDYFKLATRALVRSPRATKGTKKTRP